MIDPKGKPGDKKGGELTGEQLAKAQGEWNKKHLTPLQAELEKMKGETGKLRTSKLHKDILTAATAAGIKPEYLKALREGSDAMIVRAVADAFDYDPEAVRHPRGAVPPVSRVNI